MLMESKYGKGSDGQNLPLLECISLEETGVI